MTEISKRFRFWNYKYESWSTFVKTRPYVDTSSSKTQSNRHWHKENLNKMNDLTFIYISNTNLGNATLEQFSQPAYV